jgi:hypothetical protein
MISTFSGLARNAFPSENYQKVGFDYDFPFFGRHMIPTSLEHG